MISRKNRRAYILTVAFILLFVVTIAVLANVAGRTGSTSTTSAGCGNCHGSSASSEVTLSATSQPPNFSVPAGGVLTITVVVSHDNLPWSGTNIAVKTTPTGNTDVGALVALTHLRILNNELVNMGLVQIIGGKAEYTFTWTAPNTVGTHYLRAIGSANLNDGVANATDKWNWMDVQTITVTDPGTLAVTSPNGGEAWCPGQNNDITWNSSIINDIKIELSTNGGSTFPITLVSSTPAALGFWTWSVSDTLKGATYRIRLSDVLSANTNDVSNANFTIKNLTRILKDPVSDSLCEGRATFLYVSSSGDNLSYIWRKNRDTVLSYNNDTLFFNNLSKANNGEYDVIVKGDCGVQLSSPAILYAYSPPNIVRQPQDVVVCEGAKATIKSTVDGDGLTFRWFHKGVEIPGTYDSIFVINNTLKSDSGVYQYIVSGFCTPPDTSEVAKLHINFPTTYLQEPDDQIVSEGTSATFTVEAVGWGTKYLWYKNGNVIPAEDRNFIAFYNIKMSDSGSYKCQAWNDCGSRYSRAGKLTVIKKGSGPTIELTSSVIDFGNLLVNDSKDSTLVGIVKNSGDADLNISNISLIGNNKDDFMLLNLSIPLTINPGQSYSIRIRYTPSFCGPKTAQISFTTNAPGNSKLNLKGLGGCLSFSTPDTVINFGTVLIGTPKELPIRLKNNGTFPLEVIEMSISDTYKDVLKVNFMQTDPVTIDIDSTKIFIVTFTPLKTSNINAMMPVKFTGLDTTLIISIVGKGTVDVKESPGLNTFYAKPNPFSDITMVSCSGIGSSRVTASVYDVLGNLVFSQRILADNDDISFAWKGNDNRGNLLSSGIYHLIVFAGEGYVASIPIVIIR